MTDQANSTLTSTSSTSQGGSLPSMPVERRQTGPGHAFTLFRGRIMTLGMLGGGLFFMGQFTPFAYVRPFLGTVTRVDESMVTMVLLVIGVAGFIGTTLIGTILKRGTAPERQRVRS
jgi:predicted MFS family arabinose efflux permease